jgi:pilus assembly protein Flp/PilA
MRNRLIRFAQDETGAAAVEYGLIAALIAIGIVSAARLLGSQIGGTFNSARSAMRSA